MRARPDSIHRPEGADISRPALVSRWSEPAISDLQTKRHSSSWSNNLSGTWAVGIVRSRICFFGAFIRGRWRISLACQFARLSPSRSDPLT